MLSIGNFNVLIEVYGEFHKSSPINTRLVPFSITSEDHDPELLLDEQVRAYCVDQNIVGFKSYSYYGEIILPDGTVVIAESGECCSGDDCIISKICISAEADADDDLPF